MSEIQPRRTSHEGVEHATPAEPHTSAASERIVLNDAREPDDPGFLQRMADALIQVAERSDGLSRTAIKEELTWSLDAAGINPNATVVDRYADAILRATRSHLVIEADDGRVLGSWVGHAAGDNIRDQPGVSDAADGHRPFYS